MKKLLLLLPVLLIATLGCKYLRSEQKILSEEADTDPVHTVSDSKITINNEPVGTVSDLGPLKRKVSEIMKWREANGVLMEGTNEIENTIYVMVDPKLSVGKVAELMLAISENRGKAIIPERAVRDENTARGSPNPLTLVVKTENAVGELFPQYTGKRKHYYSPQFEFVDQALTLKIHRLINDSIEISATNQYFVNEKVNIMPESDPQNFDVKQRAIAISDLEGELSRIVTGQTKLTMIASEKASYGSLLKIFEAVDKENIDLNVTVRSQTKAP